MAPWRDDYLASLQEAERNNPVNKDLVEACSQLADRVAALEAEKLVWVAGPPTATTTKAATPAPSKHSSTNEADSTASSAEGAAQLRLDLAEALRGRGQAQTRLKAAEAELATLRSKNRVDSKRIADLMSERNALTTRLRDLNEELEKKRKFLKDVQDENLALNMELNMCLQRETKVQAENKELVDRWMKRMAHEADALNLQNESPNTNHR
ncbi:autophagy-related protein 16 [Xylaria bambusicola]|uniref:autophagy-related protein 16 n=1 Tax=Xylaria bambusicola TaxID=326684 RepID=UPI0020073E62|nr:autophagy-related protein 16 [Xylaria bambusicola]KAI0526436.1 autophagy-related protein 16 [Xylaria bambusicola]